MDSSIANKCPSCGFPNEDTSHVIRCPDPGRTAFYHDSVSELYSWLEEADTDPKIVLMIDTFLSGRGDTSAADLFSLESKYWFAATLIDSLGFDSLVEGRIPTPLVDLQREYYLGIATRWTSERWANGLIQRLLGITHRQWLYRNAVVHFKGPDGYTTAEHERILEKMKDFLWVDPEDYSHKIVGFLMKTFKR